MVAFYLHGEERAGVIAAVTILLMMFLLETGINLQTSLIRQPMEVPESHRSFNRERTPLEVVTEFFKVGAQR